MGILPIIREPIMSLKIYMCRLPLINFNLSKIDFERILHSSKLLKNSEYLSSLQLAACKYHREENCSGCIAQFFGRRNFKPFAGNGSRVGDIS